MLEHFGISIARESKIMLDARDNKIYVGVIPKMGFFQDPTDLEPTNRMIMDELVNLQGYITTMMDAFETKLKQLSNQFDYMDNDEDDDEHENP
ncbi:hypothetical protein Lal_00035473 [Lupinus albus]|nr:hypothetical protein Lal_00035473 [Lupinus albus]